MKQLLTWLLLSGVIILACQSCRNNLDDIELDNWKPVAALPLVDSSIDIYDVLNETNHPEELIIQGDGNIALNYKGELYSFSPADILEIPNQEVSENIQISTIEATAIDASTIPVSIPIGLPLEFDVGSEEVRIDEVKISSGSLNISFLREQDEFVSGNLIINEIVDENDAPLEFTISSDEPVGVTAESIVDLAGYTLIPLFSPPDIHTLNITGVIEAENNTANTAQAGDFMSFGIAFSALEFEHVIGDFGNLNVSADTDTVEILLFESIQGGTFELEEAIVSLGVTNSFGLPIELDLGEVVSVNENTNEETQLFLTDVFLDGQEELNSEPEVQTFLFDNDNSSLSSLFTPAPLNVIFEIDATGNPSGPPPMDSPNFITSESSIDIDIDVVLPLVGFANDLLIYDTLPGGITFDTYEEIDSIQFKIQTVNEYPISIDIQAIFLDENNAAFDSLFVEQTQLIEAADTDDMGNVISSSHEVVFTSLDDVRSADLQNMESIVLIATFNTYDSENSQNVRINDSQTLDIKIGAKVYGNIEL